jgi:hypothetical protein
MKAVQNRSTLRKGNDGLSVTVPVPLRASTLAALVVLLLQYGRFHIDDGWRVHR